MVCETDMKPKMKNHYRAHRLSFWLSLVPELHHPGGEDVPRSHHQLDPGSEDHDMHQVSHPDYSDGLPCYVFLLRLCKEFR